MQVDLQQRLIRNPLLFRYLRENSYWYKYLHRGDEAFPLFEREMKERYKVRMQDKMENLSQSLQMIRTFMDVIR